MAVEYKDYYKILGVDKNADNRVIRQAYRKLARQYHPDVNPGDRVAEERFKEINEAYEVLSDPEKRKKYDELSSYYQRYGRWPGASGSGGYRYQTITEEDLEDLLGGASPFSDFFEMFFGTPFGGRARTVRTAERQTAVGRDVESALEVTLAEAYDGATRVVELEDVDGSRRRLEVKIPAGVEDGARIRIPAQGLQGAAGRGDLYLRVHVRPDPRFTREGTTLRTRLEVPLVTAMLGGEAEVPTPAGRRLLLKIPPETPDGKAFRLRGQGMPVLGQPEQRGDLYAEVHVSLPAHLTAEQRRLFEAFARSLT